MNRKNLHAIRSLTLCGVMMLATAMTAQAQMGAKLKAASKIAKAMATGTEIEITEQEDYVSGVDMTVDGKSSDVIKAGADKVTFKLNVDKDFAQHASNDHGYEFVVTVRGGYTDEEMLDKEILEEDESSVDWSKVAQDGHIEFTYSKDEFLRFVETDNNGLYYDDKLSIEIKLIGRDKSDYSVKQVASKKMAVLETGGDAMNAEVTREFARGIKEPSPISDQALLQRIYRYAWSELTDVQDILRVKAMSETDLPLKGYSDIDAKVYVKYKDGSCHSLTILVRETLSSNNLQLFTPQYGWYFPCSISDEVKNTSGWKR